jgi:acyl-coenzyme A thioesterase PaaI-like protein
MGLTLKDPDGRKAAPICSPRPQRVCFACGADHPHGLKLQFRADGGSAVIADWTPSNIWEGFQGIIHGGIVSTVLDEAMSKAVATAAKPALTCHLEVRLRRHVVPGESMVVRGWVVEKRKRRIRVEADLRDRLNVERAHAWATFLEVSAPVPKSSMPAGACLDCCAEC